MLRETRAKTVRDLIAPCGMNCGICLGYLREKRRCPGCRGEEALKAEGCRRCRIKNCPSLRISGRKYCFSCGLFPCERVKHLDKRYRTTYGMSMIENLAAIRDLGIRTFVKNESRRWKCPNCGGTFCVHRADCPSCGKKRPEKGLKCSNWKGRKAAAANRRGGKK